MKEEQSKNAEPSQICAPARIGHKKSSHRDLFSTSIVQKKNWAYRSKSQLFHLIPNIIEFNAIWSPLISNYTD